MQYHDGNAIDRNSDIWKLHNNTYEKQTVAAGIEKHYVDNAMSLNVEDYILYAGMVQSEMLEYSLECFRFKLFCAGGLFWMYNDAWGEVGWSIIDYYLRRKISFYGVKRAFEHVKLIIREVDKKVVVTGCNDSNEDINFTAKIGYISFDGKIDETTPIEILLPKHSRAEVFTSPLPDCDYKNGIFAIIPDDEALSPAYLRVHDKRNLNLPKPDVKIISSHKEKDTTIVKLTSPVFANGVHIKGNAKCSDNYFDLLPGEVKTLKIADINPDDVELFT
jgi:beta-mannosidase